VGYPEVPDTRFPYEFLLFDFSPKLMGCGIFIFSIHIYIV